MQSQPYARPIATVFNQSAPGANTNILSTALTPIRNDSVFRITVCLATASVLNTTVTSSGTTKTIGLNASSALQAGDMYTFSFGVRSTYTYNFQVETDGVINLLLVEEVVGGVL